MMCHYLIYLENHQTIVWLLPCRAVDSSVVAALLHHQGYDVVGITLQLYDHGAAIQKKGACCAGQDIYDARKVADQMGFPHFVLDYENKFKDSVIDKFVDSYLAGSTPIPCVECNMEVKFKRSFGCCQGFWCFCDGNRPLYSEKTW